MGAPAQSDSQAADKAPRLQRLLPPGSSADVETIVEQLGLWQASDLPPERPRVLLNMVSSADGHATLQGRSGPISSPADRALFHALRTPVDAVLVGAGTIRIERYGRIVRDDARRSLRVTRGLHAEPLACVVSASLALAADIPLLADREARVVIVTPSERSLPEGGAELHYVRSASRGLLDLSAALAQLRERFHVRCLLCEGGPHLAGQLFAAGLVDELFLSLSPKLIGGPEGDAGALRILAGEELRPPVELSLLGVLHSDSHLFLRYGVRAGE